MTANRRLIADVRSGLQALADPEHAAGQQAYIKSAMPYCGIRMAGVREVCARVFPRHPLAGFEEWRDTVLTLWRDAGYREERCVAIELSGWCAYRDHQGLEALPTYEEIVVTGAWWDYVDACRLHRAEPRGQGVLHPQGDRVGAACLCLGGARVGPSLCGRQRKPAQRAKPAGGIEERRPGPSPKTGIRS